MIYVYLEPDPGDTLALVLRNLISYPQITSTPPRPLAEPLRLDFTWNGSAPTGRISVKFDIWNIKENP